MKKNPEVTYSESGDYRPLLNATNAKYTDHSQMSSMSRFSEKRKLQTLFATVKLSMTKPLYRKKLIPGTNDYVSGINKYYTTFAEKFELPSEAEASISGVHFRLYLYKAATTNKGKPVRVRLYADKWGAPDTDNVFGEYVTNHEWLPSVRFRSHMKMLSEK